ncbi:hypothetical protein [Frankia sp. Cr2]|uniref:hypothetical protein n=1 Tax=Frankia sp. Cr2 TaxID=3073932 RepID=UPI002AD50824|nr:hypothetical protein [Frankia sp. Cr2]
MTRRIDGRSDGAADVTHRSYLRWHAERLVHGFFHAGRRQENPGQPVIPSDPGTVG